MYEVTSLDLLEDVPLEQLCVVEESPQFPGELVWQVAGDQQAFYSRYKDWLSRYLVLNQAFTLKDFVKQLENDNRRVVFLESARPILEAYERWESPLAIQGFTAPNDGELYNYQTFSLNRALEDPDHLYFYGWAPGTGKSIAATAGAQELFNRGRIDLVLCFTLMKLKLNMADFFTTTTDLHAMVNDGPVEKRHRTYGSEMDVFVLNYEKADVDFHILKNVVKQRRTLFVLDECQKVLTTGGRTKARQGVDHLIKQAHRPVVWPMSATVVSHSPFKYRDVFALGPGPNPLGTKTEFEQRYVKSRRSFRIPTKHGGYFDKTEYTWDLANLQEVRHRVARCAHNVRKTDAGVRDNFKGLQSVVVPVQMSDQDRKLYDAVTERALGDDQNLSSYYRVLRYICNNPTALLHTEDEVGQSIRRDYRGYVTAAQCAKLEMFLDAMEALRGAGDRCAVFSQWTHLSLFLLHHHLEERGIRHVMHYGVGQSARESQDAVREFKRDPDITVFLSSDAGAYGLNLQECRYVVNYEVPYSYDTWIQRINRIDRVDSYLDGLTAYNYVTENTVEERIWAILNQRRELAAATLGTTEELSYESENNPKTLSHLIFGKK